MKCEFCQQYRREFNSALNTETSDWEYWASNESSIREAESEANIQLREQASDLMDKDPVAASALFEKAYSNGSLLAARQLGWHYETGKGLERDTIKAKEYYEVAWKGGSQLAGLEFARCSYRDNQYPQSVDTLQKLAHEGFIVAHYYIANYTANHEQKAGTHRDVLPHLQTVARSGHPYATFWLGRMMFQGKLGLTKVPAGAKMFWPLMMRIHKQM